MCKNHDMYHFPVELRDVAYRIVDVDTPDADVRTQRKAVAFMLLKQAAVAGLLEALDAVVAPRELAKAHQIRAKLLSISAMYSAEASELYKSIIDDDVPF